MSLSHRYIRYRAWCWIETEYINNSDPLLLPVVEHISHAIGCLSFRMYWIVCQNWPFDFGEVTHKVEKWSETTININAIDMYYGNATFSTKRPKVNNWNGYHRHRGMFVYADVKRTPNPIQITNCKLYLVDAMHVRMRSELLRHKYTTRV